MTELTNTPAPSKFAADDQVFRAQLPKAIAAVRTMISDAAAGNKNAVLQAMNIYANNMMPTVTDALDDVDPSVVHT